MKQGLQLRLNQQLALTPQLQQAIRLLQLSNLELGAELRQICDTNPLLMLDDLDDDPGVTSETDADKDADPAAANDGDGEEFAADLGEEPLEFDAAPIPAPTASGVQREDASAAETLREHLIWQLNLAGLTTVDLVIGAVLADALDADGYLREDEAGVRAALPATLLDIDRATIEAVRQRLLRLDPVGVGAGDLAECLAVQLEVLPAATPGRELALRIVDSEMELLARADMQRLARKLGVDAASAEQAVALIRSLNPRPGADFQAAPVEYVVPDAYAVRRHGRWRVSLSSDCQPRLEINEHYTQLMAKAREDDANYLRSQLQEARWLIKSLQSRAETILKVGTAIVRAQSAFLDFGPEAMRPLTLRDIAEEVGLHESTVSRVTTRKYLHTPRGIFEFKHFFSSGVGTDDGGSASATAVQAMIRKLVDAENRRRPLSDQALTRKLNQAGIQVARRTVAKYREALRIPSSAERINLEEGN